MKKYYHSNKVGGVVNDVNKISSHFANQFSKFYLDGVGVRQRRHEEAVVSHVADSAVDTGQAGGSLSRSCLGVQGSITEQEQLGRTQVEATVVVVFQ